MDLDDEMKKYIATYNLVTHADERNKESFFHVTLMAHFLLNCLKIGNYFGVVTDGGSSTTTPSPPPDCVLANSNNLASGIHR